MKKQAASTLIGLSFSLNSFAFPPNSLHIKMCGNTKTFPIASKVCLAESSQDSETLFLGHCEGLFMIGDEPECTLTFKKVTGTQTTAATKIYQANFFKEGENHRQVLRVSNVQNEEGKFSASLRIDNAYAHGGQFFSMAPVKD